MTYGHPDQRTGSPDREPDWEPDTERRARLVQRLAAEAARDFQGHTDPPARRFPVRAVAGAMALAALVAMGGWALSGVADACDDTPLIVTASPDIAPVLERIGDDFCGLRVAPQASAEVANALAAAGVNVGPSYDVWVPDSSIWVDQVRAGAAEPSRVPNDNVSIASSPTVIAMPAPVAGRLSGGSGGMDWSRLLRELDGEPPLQIGFADPTTNTISLGALVSIGQVIGNSPAAHAKQVDVMRSIFNGGGFGRTFEEVFDKLPKTRDAAVIAASVGAVPASEQAVWKYNAERPAVPLVAAYPIRGALRLDYPYVTLAASAEKRQAAQAFLAELTKHGTRRALQTDGFRSPDGTAGPALSLQAGTNPQVPQQVGKPPAAFVSTTIKSWQVVDQQ